MVSNANSASTTERKVYLGLRLCLLLYAGVVQAADRVPRDASDLVIVTPDTVSVRVEASVQSDADYLVIRGSVQRQRLTHQVVMGHIDVKVFGNTGDLLLEQPVSYYPNPIKPRPTARSRFDWRVPSAVSAGSRVELSFHTGRHTPRE